MRAVITVGQLGKAYDLDLFDFGRDSLGLAITNGTGALLTVMDHRPDLNWALSVEGLQLPLACSLVSFLEAVACLAVPVAAYLTFSLHDPEPLREALSPLKDALEYCSNVDLPGRAVSLSELLREPA
jgi:hypothetical protein